MPIRIPLHLCLWFAAAGALHGYELLAEFPRPAANPLAALVLAGDGNYYGTSPAGGASNMGAVFRVTPAGSVSIVVSFTGIAGAAPGSTPASALTLGADGSLYGVTTNGGTTNFGTVFKVTTAGGFTSIATFTGTAGAPKGSAPQSLVLHSNGNFYGVTLAGGAGGQGTVFQMTPAGAIATLVEFTGTAGVRKGAQPQGPLVFSGNTLFGVTKTGGAGGLGTVFSVTTAGVWTLLVEFTGTTGTRLGSAPTDGLFLNTDGALYGTTEFGGTNDFGTAFRINSGFTTLRSFSDATGSQPTGAFVKGADSQLYGVTAAGGSAGYGVAYKMTTSGTQTVLTHFSGESGATPGAAPRGGLIAAAAGGFIGATSAGGPGNLGVVYTVTGAGVYQTVAHFSPAGGWLPSGAPIVESGADLLFPLAAGGANGQGVLGRLTTGGTVGVAAPMGGLIGNVPTGALVKVGNDFFGVTAAGGASGRGTAYKFNSASGAALLASYTSTGGAASEGPLVPGVDGALYGVSREGGALTRGTFYKVTTDGIRTRLLSFSGATGSAKGTRPRGPLALAANGNFYGAAEAGGAADAGTLFSLTPSGAYTAIAEFGAAGPRLPLGGMVVLGDGMVYGTTSRGGAADAGCIIRINPTDNSWSVAAEFVPAATGSSPVGPLTVGPGGYLYGQCASGGGSGYGTVFRYSAFSGLQALESFTGLSGAAPGMGNAVEAAVTFSGGITFGQDGKLYGTAAGGGSGGGGTAFRLNPATPFSVWKALELGSANASDLADPESDGLSALLEYALGLNPGVSDAGSLPVAFTTETSGEKFLSIVVPRDPSRPDLIVAVEASSGLNGPWNAVATSVYGAPFAGPGYMSGDSAGPGLKQVQVRDTVSLTSATRRFLRVRATR